MIIPKMLMIFFKDSFVLYCGTTILCIQNIFTIMKNIQNKLILLLCTILTVPSLAYSQDNDLDFEVNRVNPYISITKEDLNAAKSITDLNARYKPSWVKEYISVELLTCQQGNIIKSVSENDLLSQEQKDIMNRADAGTDITVVVKYMPENTLMYNEPKELSFMVAVDPENEAIYPGGQQQLEDYLKENAINKISNTSYEAYDLTAIKFTINEEGQVVDAHIFGADYQTSVNEEIDALLLETIRNMPSWKPAEYADGTKVKQEFVLTVGNMENCIVHLLNI